MVENHKTLVSNSRVMVAWLFPFKLYHFVTFRNWAGEDWLVRNTENGDNVLFCEGTSATAVLSSDLILVDFGRFEICSRIGVDSEVWLDLLELAVGASVGPYFIPGKINSDWLTKNATPFNNG